MLTSKISMFDYKHIIIKGSIQVLFSLSEGEKNKKS